MKIVDMMEKVFQVRTFNNRVNVINKSFPNFWRVNRQAKIFLRALRSFIIEKLVVIKKQRKKYHQSILHYLNQIDSETK